MLNVCVLCFCRFHFLKVTYEVEFNHSSLSSHVYPIWLVTWVDVGVGCYRVVSEHGSPLELDGQCALVMHACKLHVCLLHFIPCACCIYVMLIMVVVMLSCGT